MSHPFRNPSGASTCSCSYRLSLSLSLSFSPLSFSRRRATVTTIIEPGPIMVHVHLYCIRSRCEVLSCTNVVGFARESRLPSARYAIRLSLSPFLLLSSLFLRNPRRFPISDEQLEPSTLHVVPSEAGRRASPIHRARSCLKSNSGFQDFDLHPLRVNLPGERRGRMRRYGEPALRSRACRYFTSGFGRARARAFNPPENPFSLDANS